MRHRKAGRKFNRNSSHRKAMFKNMCSSLLKHRIIKTTLPKAKELRKFIEPLITLAKIDSVAKRRLAYSRLGNREAVTTLFNQIAPIFKERNGGYTRVLKFGFRASDAAPMAIIEFVDRDKIVEEQSKVTKKDEKKDVKKDSKKDEKKDEKKDSKKDSKKECNR